MQLHNSMMMDKAAIGLSALCALHCLFFPIALVLIPSITTLGLGGEAIHKGLLFVIIPVSLLAFISGRKKHSQIQVYLAAAIGLALLIAAVALGHDILGERGEQILTLGGAAVLAFSHFLNYRLCQRDGSRHD